MEPRSTGTAVLLSLALLFLPATRAPALAVSVAGDWVLTLGAADIALGAGGDFSPVHTSAADVSLIQVADATDDTDAWQIQVHRDNLTWHPDLVLSLLRSSDGTGTGSVSGGDAVWVELTATDQVFFEGAGDRADIGIQLKLEGVSVVIGAESYGTTIFYTVIDIP